MIQNKTYKFRILPTEEQQILLSKHFGCNRFVYNHFLNEKQQHYLNTKKSLNFYNCCTILTKLKKEHIWLKEINSQSLQVTLKNLEGAYGAFIHKRSGFPKYKSKKYRNSFQIPQSVFIENDLLDIPKFKEKIKIIKHRPILGKICNATITKESSGKYFVSICCEEDIKPKEKTNKQIGLDLGLMSFIVDQNGNKVTNPKIFNQLKSKLKTHQQHLSRKQKGSHRYEKQRIKVAKIYEKITNSRNDFQHKLSHKLVTDYDIICMESLSVKDMIKNPERSRSISDVSWSSFVNKVEYKSKWYGKEFVKIDRFYPSSKTCSKCDWIYQELKESERSWICKKCGFEHNRDTNAAQNILRQGLNVLSLGINDYKRGAELRPKVTKGIGEEAFKKKVDLSTRSL